MSSTITYLHLKNDVNEDTSNGVNSLQAIHEKETLRSLKSTQNSFDDVFYMEGHPVEAVQAEKEMELLKRIEQELKNYLEEHNSFVMFENFNSLKVSPACSAIKNKFDESKEDLNVQNSKELKQIILPFIRTLVLKAQQHVETSLQSNKTLKIVDSLNCKVMNVKENNSSFNKSVPNAVNLLKKSESCLQQTFSNLSKNHSICKHAVNILIDKEGNSKKYAVSKILFRSVPALRNFLPTSFKRKAKPIYVKDSSIRDSFDYDSHTELETSPHFDENNCQLSNVFISPRCINEAIDFNETEKSRISEEHECTSPPTKETTQQSNKYGSQTEPTNFADTDLISRETKKEAINNNEKLAPEMSLLTEIQTVKIGMNMTTFSPTTSDTTKTIARKPMYLPNILTVNLLQSVSKTFKRPFKYFKSSKSIGEITGKSHTDLLKETFTLNKVFEKSNNEKMHFNKDLKEKPTKGKKVSFSLSVEYILLHEGIRYFYPLKTSEGKSKTLSEAKIENITDQERKIGKKKLFCSAARILNGS